MAASHGPVPRDQPCVSLCLIAKNEESTLGVCLASAADLVHELIVIDTGSTDRTKEVAASFGARVFDFPWCDDFAAARNESLRHATGDWIFWLDADDRIDEENRQKLRTLFASLKDENAAYVMKSRSGPHEGIGSAVDVDHVRLFRNHPELRWQYRVHEQSLPALRRLGADIRWTDIVIEHTGYQDPALERSKLQRNLRLLELDQAEHPDDPFILFNLGWTYQGLGRIAEAVPYLRQSLERSQPGDSIVRKAYSLLAMGHRQMGQPQEALAACQTGRARHPDDAEMLFLEGQLLRERGDLAAAETCFRQLLQPHGTGHFTSHDTGLRGFKTRHQLALTYRDQGKHAEAEEQWKAALAEQPQFAPAWLELGKLHLSQGRWPELEEAAQQLEKDSHGAVEASVLRARGHLARKEFAAARQLLEATIARVPQAVQPRVILTHVLLQEGRDDAAAEKALRAVVELDPGQAESWRNLAVLYRKQGRLADAVTACRSGRVHCPEDADLLLLHGSILREMGDYLGAETCLLRVLESTADSDRHAFAATNGGKEGRATWPRKHGTQSARHNLALIYNDLRRPADAEAQWRAVLAEQPDFLPAWLGLGDLYVEQQRWTELDQITRHLEDGQQSAMEAGVLRARGHLGRKEFAAARQLLEETIAQYPQALWPRVILSHVLLQEGRDWAAAEQALRDVLALDPNHREARHNLAILLREHGVTA